MFAKYSFRKKLLFTSTVVIFSIFFSLCFQSNKLHALGFPPVDTPLNGGYLSYNYSNCDYSYNTFENRPIYSCSGDYSLSATQWDSVTNDDGSITVHWRFNIGTPNDFSADDYIAISRLNFGGFDSILDNYSKSFFFNISSPYSPYLGNARSLFFPDPGNRYSLTMGGFNSYFYYVNQGQYLSCPDMNSEQCQFRYDWDTATGLGGFFYLSKNSGLPTNWYSIDSIYVVHNYYDSNNGGSYHWSPFSGSNYSVIYLMNPLRDATLLSNGYLYLDFYTTFYTTEDYFDMSASDTPGADVNDAISAEQEYITNDINNANGSNALLGAISIPISLPFSNWFSLFTDNSCVDLTTIPSWFGLSSQHLCSPWNSSIRSTLTPIVSVASTMLLFGFIISFLRGRNDGSVVDSVKGTWYG